MEFKCLPCSAVYALLMYESNGADGEKLVCVSCYAGSTPRILQILPWYLLIIQGTSVFEFAVEIRISASTALSSMN